MSAVIFNGSKVKSLKPILSLNGGAELHSGTVDVQAVATSAPAGSTYHRTDTGDVYRKLDSGSSTNWVLIGSGGGGGGINFVGLDTAMKLTSQSDVDAEVTVGNHVAYADAAGVSPVDMTGGSPGTTVTRSASSPLNGAGSIVMDLGSGSSRQGEGHSLVVNIPPGYRGLRTEYSFAFAVTGALAEDDLRLSVYDVTNAALITDVVHVNKVLGAKGIARLQFSTATTTAQIRVGLHVARTTTAALSVKMDDFQVGPKLSTVGLAGSDTYSQELTFEALGTVSSNSAKLWRVGDRLHVKGSCTLGTTTGSDAYIILPGLSIDSAKVGPQTREILGTWYRNTAAGNSLPSTQAGPFALRHVTSEPTKVSFSIAVNTAASDFVFDGVAGTSVGSSGDEIVFEFSAPIAGWSSNVTMASDPGAIPVVVQSTTSAATSVGASDTLIPFATEVKDSHAAWAADTFTAPVSGDYVVSANLAFASAAFSNDEFVFLRVYKNGALFRNIGEWAAQGSNTVSPKVAGTSTITLNKGDTLKIYANSSQTVALNGVEERNTVSISRVTGSTSLAIDFPRSEILAIGGSGHGSTNDAIRCFTSATSQGSGIEYSSDAVNGDSFTIRENGVYAISYTDSHSSAAAFGVSVNSTELTTAIQSILSANHVVESEAPAGGVGCAAVSLVLVPGDVVRAHTEGTLSSANANFVKFRITKVSS